MRPWEVLALSLRKEARLHPLGRTIMQQRIVGAMRSRLRVEAAHAADQRLGEEHLASPVVIVGLQRTGTTFLHRMLSSHPELRALASWEALYPAPFRGQLPSDSSRIRRAESAARAVAMLAPDFMAVHPIEAIEPEEEVVLFEQVGLSTGFEATLRVPSYAAWFEEQDQAPAYAWLREVLQLLQAHDRMARQDQPDDSRVSTPRRWVLKTPHHLEFLPELAATFPDLKIVWTHRDPCTTVASFCSMVAHGMGLCRDEVDAHEVGAHWLRKTSRMVQRARAFRQAHPELPVLDVAYEDLVADPLGTVGAVLDFAGLDRGPEVHGRLATQRGRTRQHKHGRHVYSLDDFGLDTTDVAAAFAEYRAGRGWT